MASALQTLGPGFNVEDFLGSSPIPETPILMPFEHYLTELGANKIALDVCIDQSIKACVFNPEGNEAEVVTDCTLYEERFREAAQRILPLHHEKVVAAFQKSLWDIMESNWVVFMGRVFLPISEMSIKERQIAQLCNWGVQFYRGLIVFGKKPGVNTEYATTFLLFSSNLFTQTMEALGREIHALRQKRLEAVAKQLVDAPRRPRGEGNIIADYQKIEKDMFEQAEQLHEKGVKLMDKIAAACVDCRNVKKSNDPEDFNRSIRAQFE